MTEVRRTKSPIRTDGALSESCINFRWQVLPDPHGWGMSIFANGTLTESSARSARMGFFLIDGMSGTVPAQLRGSPPLSGETNSLDFKLPIPNC